MCLAVPGKIVAVQDSETAFVPGQTATVDFQGSRVDVSLALTPQARQGDWVLVHAGFALSVLDEAEAAQTWEYLKAAGIGSEETGLDTPEAGPD